MPVHALKYPPMVNVLKLSVYVCVEVFLVKAVLGYMQTDL